VTDKRSSPTSSAVQIDKDVGREELLGLLNELLEAERAGAHVALASAKEAASSAYSDLMHSVKADEARWCAMLVRQIERLGGTASSNSGAFRGKAMAIADPLERLAFLNRGQSWVVRKLEALTPRVRDNPLCADLLTMLESHKVNIDRANALLNGK
jgi:hypothetical protein